MFFLQRRRRGYSRSTCRHDTCYPRTGESAASINNSDWIEDGHNARTVELVCSHPHKGWMPTFERWRSFGWIVTTTAWDT
jgi:hypothetical protein